MTPTAIAEALVRADPRLASVIAATGPPLFGPAAPDFEPDETADALVRSVVYQQLSGRAASTIHGRVLAAFGDGVRPDLAALAAAPDEPMRACGLSRAKVLAVRDVAARALDGRLPRRADLDALSDAEVEAALVAVRGVGPWTAQMIMMFTLGRPDVWPALDLGVQEGYRLVAGAAVRPTPAELLAEGERYRPFRSAAAWYLWRAVDLDRAQKPTSFS